MINCPRKFNDLYAITQNVGDDSKECDSCENLIYSAGILTCRHVLDEMVKRAREEDFKKGSKRT